MTKIEHGEKIVQIITLLNNNNNGIKIKKLEHTINILLIPEKAVMQINLLN